MREVLQAARGRVAACASEFASTASSGRLTPDRVCAMPISVEGGRLLLPNTNSQSGVDGCRCTSLTTPPPDQRRTLAGRQFGSRVLPANGAARLCCRGLACSDVFNGPLVRLLLRLVGEGGDPTGGWAVAPERQLPVLTTRRGYLPASHSVRCPALLPACRALGQPGGVGSAVGGLSSAPAWWRAWAGGYEAVSEGGRE